MNLRLLLIILLAAVVLPGCCALDRGTEGDFEKVTSLWIDPSNPGPGETVEIHVTLASNLVYLPDPAVGPRVKYRVSAGELLFPENSMYYHTRVSDQEVIAFTSDLQWRLPTNADAATIWATLRSGGKTLTVKFD